MDKFNYIRLIALTSRIILLILIFSFLGCVSIQSKSVRALIDIETEKIGQASKNAEEFVKANKRAIDEWEKSVESLNNMVKNQKKIEGVHSLVFSANQNIATKTGIHAHAAGYLIGEIYLADRMGLEQVVRDQFKQDFEAVKKLAKQIDESWVALKKTQNEVSTFANKSFLATVDANLAKALVVEFAGDSEMIDGILRRSRQVNEAVKKASGLGLLEGQDSGRAKTVIEDILNLLGRIK
jgi:hypothetical protein